VGGLDLMRAAGPDLTRAEGTSWWTSPDVVMVAHPYLNPGRGTDPQVFVLARTGTVQDRVRTRLAEGGISGSLFATGDIYGAVPTE
jgi:hypothetical protein